jgi:hypothetical protein
MLWDVGDEERSLTCPERLVLLAVDQQLGEGVSLRVALELADLVGPLEVGEHEDVEQLGVRSRPEGIEALLQSLLKLIRTHVNRRLTAWPDGARPLAIA